MKFRGVVTSAQKVDDRILCEAEVTPFFHPYVEDYKNHLLVEGAQDVVIERFKPMELSFTVPQGNGENNSLYSHKGGMGIMVTLDIASDEPERKVKEIKRLNEELESLYTVKEHYTAT
jgi:hypothetical protein